jgi:hypothetical protein
VSLEREKLHKRYKKKIFCILLLYYSQSLPLEDYYVSLQDTHFSMNCNARSSSKPKRSWNNAPTVSSGFDHNDVDEEDDFAG